MERQVAVVKQAFWSNWLEVEAKLSISSQTEKLPLGGMLWRMCLLYVSRTINLYLSSPGDAATWIWSEMRSLVDHGLCLSVASVYVRWLGPV